MTNSNINSLTLSNSIAQADKLYFARSPFGSTDDRAAKFSAINSSFNHDTLLNYDVNKHRAMGTAADSLTLWSGYHINSLLATKQNSTDLAALSTYATSAALTSLTNNHSTWIQSISGTKLNSINLSTYATSSALDSFSSSTSTWIQSISATKLNSININGISTYATSINLDAHTGISSIHRGMGTSADTITTWSGFQINSLFNTKQNSTNLTNLSTYATSVNLDAHTSLTSIHRGMDTSTSTIVVWSGYQINSLLATKLNSINLATYATSAALQTHISSVANHINSDVTSVTGADKISNAMSLTTAEYAAIGTPDAATLYVITDA